MEELGESRKGTFAFGLIENLKSKGKPINFDEFLELVCPKVGEVRTKEGLKTIFGHIDRQEDEVIDFEELKNLARLSGDGINDDEIMEHSTPSTSTARPALTNTSPSTTSTES